MKFLCWYFIRSAGFVFDYYTELGHKYHSNSNRVPGHSIDFIFLRCSQGKIPFRFRYWHDYRYLNPYITFLNSLAGSCQVQPNGGSYTTATCSSSGNEITITGVTFPAGLPHLFKLNNLIQTPAANRTALIDITAYQTGGTTVIESWATSLVVIAPSFTSQSVSSLCVGDGKSTVLTFTFVPNVVIPESIQQTTTNDTTTFIEFEFSDTATDLGTGLTTKSSIPCNPESGLSPGNFSLISF